MKKLSFNDLLESARENFMEFIYPSGASCYLCDDDIDFITKSHLCSSCKSLLPFIKRPCKKCGKEIDENDSCRDCMAKKYYFNRAISVCNFEGMARECVYKYKGVPQRSLGEVMAFFMYCTYANSKLNANAIICVPTSKVKMKERGFNPARDLLVHINRRLHLEDLSKCVYEVDGASNQKALGASGRAKNVKYKFKVRNASKFKGKNILLIDDVLTTGATANRIAQMLRYGGANKVYVLTFASVKDEREKHEKAENLEDLFDS